MLRILRVSRPIDLALVLVLAVLGSVGCEPSGPSGPVVEPQLAKPGGSGKTETIGVLTEFRDDAASGDKILSDRVGEANSGYFGESEDGKSTVTETEFNSFQFSTRTSGKGDPDRLVCVDLSGLEGTQEEAWLDEVKAVTSSCEPMDPGSAKRLVDVRMSAARVRLTGDDTPLSAGLLGMADGDTGTARFAVRWEGPKFTSFRLLFGGEDGNEPGKVGVQASVDGSLRQWTLTSDGTHAATLIRSNRREDPASANLSMPFSVTLTEL